MVVYMSRFCYREAMSRPLRIQYPGAVYHVMNRGAVRQNIFADPADYQAFLDTVGEAHRLWGIEVFAYCLIGNHYHLCLTTPKGNLSRVMRHIDGLYTQRFNRRHRRDGALFRGRYKAILVDKDQYLVQVVRYIHLNPVEAKLAELPEEYRWASHGEYLKPKAVPQWINPKPALEQIGGRQAFHEFVLSGNEERLEEYYRVRRHTPILGGEEFVERMKQPEVARQREHARYERRALQVTPERVIGEVVGQYPTTPEEILRGKRGTENEARKLAMYLIKRCCDRTLGEIAVYCGAGSYATVSWSCRWIEAKMIQDQRFRDRVERMAKRIQQPQT